MVSNLVPQIRQDMIKQRLKTTIDNVVNQVQKMYNEYTEEMDPALRNEFSKKCNATFGMKDVLTDLHKELTSRKQGDYYELLQAGVSNDQLNKYCFKTTSNNAGVH